MTLNLRVSLDFAGYSDPDLDEFASNIVVSLGTPSFPAPPVLPTALGVLQGTFHDAVIAAMPGGVQLTAAKNTARAALLDALRKDAAYVQSIASHSLDMLLSSGYNVISTNHAQTPLGRPVISKVENLASTKLLVRITPLLNAKAYQMQICINGNTWLDAGIFTQARRVVLEGLMPGTTYSIRVRGIGGSTGYSEWSHPVSLMAT